MSREGAQRPEPAATGGTPIWVWAIYVLGILAATIIVLSVLFSIGAYISDVDVTLNVSTPAIVLWGGLTALAGGLWIWRRRQGRR